MQRINVGAFCSMSCGQWFEQTCTAQKKMGGEICSLDKFLKFWFRLDKIETDFAKIGTDKNLEISDFSI